LQISFLTQKPRAQRLCVGCTWSFVSESLSFERVLKALGETGADLLPVIDHDAYFKGVISYEEVKNTLYDPFLRDLVIAEDLTSSVDDALDPGASLTKALEVLDRHRVPQMMARGNLTGCLLSDIAKTQLIFAVNPALSRSPTEADFEGIDP